MRKREEESQKRVKRGKGGQEGHDRHSVARNVFHWNLFELLGSRLEL